MQLGYGLIQLVDDEKDGPLIARITGVRKQISKEIDQEKSKVKVAVMIIRRSTPVELDFTQIERS